VTLHELNVRIGAAERAHDEAFLDEVMHPDLAFRRADSSIVGKTNYLAGVAARELTLMESDVVAVMDGQHSSVATVLVDAAGTSSGAAFSGRFHNTRVFVPGGKHGFQCILWINVRAQDAGNG
jgi:hypothetical protein